MYTDLEYDRIYACMSYDLSHINIVHIHVSTLPGPGDNNKSCTTERRTEHANNDPELHMRKHITEEQLTVTKV